MQRSAVAQRAAVDVVDEQHRREQQHHDERARRDATASLRHDGSRRRSSAASGTAAAVGPVPDGALGSARVVRLVAVEHALQGLEVQIGAIAAADLCRPTANCAAVVRTTFSGISFKARPVESAST